MYHKRGRIKPIWRRTDAAYQLTRSKATEGWRGKDNGQWSARQLNESSTLDNPSTAEWSNTLVTTFRFKELSANFSFLDASQSYALKWPYLPLRFLLTFTFAIHYFFKFLHRLYYAFLYFIITTALIISNLFHSSEYRQWYARCIYELLLDTNKIPPKKGWNSMVLLFFPSEIQCEIAFLIIFFNFNV